MTRARTQGSGLSLECRVATSGTEDALPMETVPSRLANNLVGPKGWRLAMKEFKVYKIEIDQSGKKPLVSESRGENRGVTDAL